MHLCCSPRNSYVWWQTSHRNFKQISLPYMGGQTKWSYSPWSCFFFLYYPKYGFSSFHRSLEQKYKKREEKVLTWNEVLTLCPLGVTEWMQWLSGYMKVSKTRRNPVSWAKLLVCEPQLPPTLMSCSDTGSQPWQSPRILIAGVWEIMIHS